MPGRRHGQSVAELAEDMLIELDTRGWTKGFNEDANGAVCLEGAAMYALFGEIPYLSHRGRPGDLNWERWDRACRMIALLTARAAGCGRLPFGCSLTRFNDDRATTEEDVRLLLKEVAYT